MRNYTITRPLKAIRLKCIDCCGWNTVEVEKCEHKACILYELRFGMKPKGKCYSKITKGEYRKRVEEA